jgi:hypothetical protein
MMIETNDPETRPLPDFNIMEMHWFLHRLSAISGASEIDDEIYDDDFSDLEDAVYAIDDEKMVEDAGSQMVHG